MKATKEFKNILIYKKYGCVYALDSDGTLLYRPICDDNKVRIAYDDFGEVDYDEFITAVGTRTEYYRIKHHLALCNAENSIKFIQQGETK
jgi:hypothetical protein